MGGVHNPPTLVAGGAQGLDANYEVDPTIDTDAGTPVAISGAADPMLTVTGTITANVVQAGDLSFSDPGCAICENEFQVGEEITLAVVKTEPNDSGQMITYTQPIHSACKGGK